MEGDGTDSRKGGVLRKIKPPFHHILDLIEYVLPGRFGTFVANAIGLVVTTASVLLFVYGLYKFFAR